MERARERTNLLLERAQAIGDERALVAATISAGSFAFWDGNCAECRALTESLLPIAPRLRFNERAWVMQLCGIDTYFGSLSVRQGLDIIERMRPLVGSSVRGAIGIDIALSGLVAMQDEGATFDAAVMRIDDAWHELGDPDERHMAMQGRGESLRWLGRNDEAEAVLRDAKAFLDRSGGTGYNSTVTSILATFVAEDGRIDEAAELIENARPMVAADDFGATVPLGWASALVASAAGDHETALREIDQALASVSRTDFLNFHADTLRIQGMVLLAAGRDADAATAFDEAAAMWERKENVASIHRLGAWRAAHAV
jgi:predicted negative regulator of RcsB-dependent stress response